MSKVLVSLTVWWKDLIDDLVEKGVYASRSELIRSALLVWFDEVYMKSRGLQTLSVVE